MNARTRNGMALGLHPMDRGFGWVVLSEPSDLIDWGYVDERRADKNARCIARIERLVERYRPSVVTLEQFEGGFSRRAGRIRRLCRAIVRLSETQRIAVRIYSRAQIRACFAEDKATSRYEVALAIAERFDVVRHRLPRFRKPWMNEHPGMALFSAIAVALTHFARKSGGTRRA